MRGKLVLLLTVLLMSGRVGLAQQEMIDSLWKVVGTGSDSSKVRALNELSWYYKNSNVDSAALLAWTSLALAKKTENQTLIAESYNSLGSAKQASGEYDSALSYIQQAILIKSSRGDSSALAIELSNMGIIYDERGDYEKALRCYFSALRIARRNKDLRKEANTLSNIGVVYKKEKQYDKVLEYYNSALAIYQKLNSDFGITVTSGNIGSVMLQTRDYEKSIEYALKAKAGYEKLGYTRYVPYTIGNMAIANDSLHRYRKAEELYNEAFARHLEFENRYEAAYNSKNLASFYLRQQQPVRAKPFAQKAIQLSSEIGAKEMLRDAYLVMSTVSQSLGQFREAYAYQLKYDVLKDSLFEETKTKSILEMQVKYEAEAKELQIANQRVQLATTELELQQRQNEVLWLASVSAILLVAGAFVFQYQRAKRRKAEQEAAFKLKLSDLKAENELQQDRQRISRELHDNIGSRLLFLVSNAESLAEKVDAGEREKAHQLGSFAKNTLHELRRTVWFINQDFVSLEELQMKMGEYFGFLSQSPEITLTATWQADPSIVVRSSVAAAIFRVAQEAVSNSLKHAEASSIGILVSSDASGIELRVSDNGKGFQKKNGGVVEGNGLRNMSANAAAANGTITIDSSNGTSVVLKVPLG